MDTVDTADAADAVDAAHLTKLLPPNCTKRIINAKGRNNAVIVGAGAIHMLKSGSQ